MLKDQLRAIMVCVDYSDILALTLPYNRHHFSQVMIVTTESDKKTIELAKEHRCLVYETDAFYRNGAVFNKWLALEEGLDRLNRVGWICLMDADVLWPKVIPEFKLELGKLYSPLRHMYDPLKLPLPAESEWSKYVIHPNVNEWAGYTQIFSAHDPVLQGSRYWHEVDWTHAGGADSYFQFKWKPELKVRTPFNVLHLGPAGINWCGRASALVDGTFLQEAEVRKKRLYEFVGNRRKLQREGKDRHSWERLK